MTQDRGLHRATGAGFVLTLVASALFAGCIDSSDCVDQGVRIEPCSVPMRVGQTRIFSATVTADPNDDVNWVRTDALDAGFTATVGDHQIELVGTLGVGALYPLRAESASDPNRFGESIVTVIANTYGYPPPPVQINGTDEPTGYQSAVAAGGNRYYMAYANPNVPRGPVAENFFVKQFDVATNRELETITGQFVLFDPQNPNSVGPNIVADCQGNGYWLDRTGAFGPDVLRRLSASGTLSEFVFSNHALFGMLAVDCEGAIYFDGGDFDETHVGLFRISVFGEDPVAFPITGIDDPSSIFETLVIDPQGRLLLADADPEFCSSPGAGLDQIVRVDPVDGVGVPDPDFDPRRLSSEPSARADVPFTEGVQALAVDGTGVVYVIPIPDSDCFPLPSTEVVFLNSAGLEVDAVHDYYYPCTAVCPVNCSPSQDPKDRVFFQNLRSIAVSAQGKLRVIDDVDLCDVKDPNCLPPECLVTVRLILLDP